jgi:hypothetical protein
VISKGWIPIPVSGSRCPRFHWLAIAGGTLQSDHSVTDHGSIFTGFGTVWTLSVQPEQPASGDVAGSDADALNLRMPAPARRTLECTAGLNRCRFVLRFRIRSEPDAFRSRVCRRRPDLLFVAGCRTAMAYRRRSFASGAVLGRGARPVHAGRFPRRADLRISWARPTMVVDSSPDLGSTSKSVVSDNKFKYTHTEI